MDVNDKRFEDYQQQFEAIAELAETTQGAQPEAASAKHMLCLYGDNGLDSDEEFALLKELEAYVGEGLKRVDIDTNYWQDTILYVL